MGWLFPKQEIFPELVAYNFRHKTIKGAYFNLNRISEPYYRAIHLLQPQQPKKYNSKAINVIASGKAVQCTVKTFYNSRNSWVSLSPFFGPSAFKGGRGMGGDVVKRPPGLHSNQSSSDEWPLKLNPDPTPQFPHQRSSPRWPASRVLSPPPLLPTFQPSPKFPKYQGQTKAMECSRHHDRRKFSKTSSWGGLYPSCLPRLANTWFLSLQSALKSTYAHSCQ